MFRKSKEITAYDFIPRGLKNIFERSLELQITEGVRNIVLILVAATCFSPNIMSKVLVSNFRELNRIWVDVQRGIVSSHGEWDPL